MSSAGEIRELFAGYLRYLKELNYSPTSLESYTVRMRFFFSFLTEMGIKTLDEITPELMEKYIIHCRGLRTLTDEPFTVTTRYCLATVVRKFFGYLQKKEIVKSNPCAGIKFTKVKSQPPYNRVLTEEEINALMAQPLIQRPLGLRDRSVMELMYSTGMRLNELHSLNIGDISGDEVKVYGKGKKERMLPIGKIAQKYLKDYLKERLKLVKDRNEPALYVSHLGRRFSRVDIWRMIREYSKSAKISKRVSPHSLRHTFATHLMENGADIRYVQELLGHAAIDTTGQYIEVLRHDLKMLIKRHHPRERD